LLVSMMEEGGSGGGGICAGADDGSDGVE
jgi:hypothetical protein